MPTLRLDVNSPHVPLRLVLNIYNSTQLCSNLKRWFICYSLKSATVCTSLTSKQGNFTTVSSYIMILTNVLYNVCIKPDDIAVDDDRTDNDDSDDDTLYQISNYLSIYMTGQRPAITRIVYMITLVRPVASGTTRKNTTCTSCSVSLLILATTDRYTCVCFATCFSETDDDVTWL